mgnify:CR=1 FL=1
MENYIVTFEPRQNRASIKLAVSIMAIGEEEVFSLVERAWVKLGNSINKDHWECRGLTLAQSSKRR